MKKIGITGGIGCGKSLAAEIIKKAGYPVLDCDELTSALWQDSAVVARIGERLREFGYLGADFTPEGVKAVASGAFRDMQIINLLEETLQPFILEKMNGWLMEREAEGKDKAFVVVPLLFECGLQYLFDETVTINVENEIRERRLQLSRLLSAAEINLRFNRQWANWAHSRYADVTIENNGTKEEFEKAVSAYLGKEEKI